MKDKIFLPALLFLFLLPGCIFSQILPGADQPDEYLPLLTGRSVGLVANHTSLKGETHLVDFLISREVKLVKIFTPEHGFRGNHADGSLVEGSLDRETGLPLVSLYGEKRKPSAADLEGIDQMVFDLQDVGVRCYTYLSTLHLVMEACAENGIPLLVLDRPNPNGYYTDGPMLLPENRSFVGMHPIPLVHGMTLGELAGMINGEGWLGDSLSCDLRVVPCRNYTHRSHYRLPVPPSPNLPNMQAVYLYPSLVLFEGTVISVGRGTEFPFQVFGHPEFEEYPLEFTPVSIPGVSENPPHNGVKCFGVDLREVPEDFLYDEKGIILDWLLAAYEESGKGEAFFSPYFSRIAGTRELQQMIMEGRDKYHIKWVWKKDLDAFREQRKPYLLYEE